MHHSHQVTANAEEVADESMHGQESLCLPGRFELSHVSLAVPCGLVGDFGAIVLVSVRAMSDRRHDRSVRRPVAAQLVGDQPPRLTLLALQQLAGKACGSPAVAPRLDEDIEDGAILIDGTPEIVSPSLDGDEDLVQVPDVAQPALSTFEPPSVVGLKRVTPQPDRFVGHRDATLSQEIFDIAKAHSEAVSRPGELHPQPLVERYVNLSAHTAPIRRTHLASLEMTNGCAFIRISSWRTQLDTDKTARRRPFAPSP